MYHFQSINNFSFNSPHSILGHGQNSGQSSQRNPVDSTKPEALAYLALKQLNNTIIEQFENLAKQMSFAVTVISLEMKLHDYTNLTGSIAVNCYTTNNEPFLESIC
uniref:Uncharacterized protein n=1 Tax=Globodera rostochiensis TaxID=31243 RepID=A0A914HKD9_GLORO